jgi:hypothetical protein
MQRFYRRKEQEKIIGTLDGMIKFILMMFLLVSILFGALSLFG